MMSLQPNFSTVLDALRCGRPGCRCQRAPANGQVLVHCPAHEDREPSLSLSVAPDGRLLWHCFAGCPQEAIQETLQRRGLLPAGGSGSPGPAGLTVEALAEAKGLPAEFLRGLGLTTVKLQGRPAVVIPYYDRDGNESAVRYRLALQGEARFRWRRGSRVLPYGLDRLEKARKAGYVVLVEGESDSWVCWLNGIPALGIPGASTWRPDWAGHLDGLKVYVWKEPDRGGDTLATAVLRDIPQALVIQPPAGAKDLADLWFRTGRDPEKFRAELSALMARARSGAQLRAEALSAEARTLYEKARPVLEAPDPLALVAAELRRLGYGGDLRPALLLYLAATTRLLRVRLGSMPTHVQVVGPPSGGKSYTVTLVLRLLPPEAWVEVPAGSPRVLIYAEWETAHRLVVFGEADSLPSGEDNPAASAVRSLLQDNVLAYDVVERDPETGRFTVRHIDRPGPTVLVTTTTRPIRGQLGTRLLTLAVPETPEQLRAALETQARLELEGAAEPGEELSSFQAWLQRQAPIDVVVPFASILAELIGRSANAARILRDYAKIISLVKAHAVLNIGRRERDPTGRLVATVEDYRAVYALVAEFYETSLLGAERSVRRLAEVVAELRRGNPAGRVSYNQVAQAMGLHREQVRRLARQAIELGWVVNRETRRNHPADLDVGDPVPETVGLPTPEQVASQMSQLPVTFAEEFDPWADD